jgi:membrane-bound hydrogenase subunit beta
MTETKAWRDAWLEERASAVTIQRDRRIFVTVARNALKEVLEWLVKVKDFTYMSTMTGSDVGMEIEVIYHLACKAVVLSVRVLVPKDDPTLPSVIDLIPGSAFYEREVHDLLGVAFHGNPDQSPLVLPDGWPSDVHPLRREWPPERIKRRLERS